MKTSVKTATAAVDELVSPGVHGSIESSLEEHATLRPTAIYGLRTRAILVALPLLFVISYISLYADMVISTIQFGSLQLAPPAVAGLFLLVLFNKGLTRLVHREFLNACDILVIYMMMLVSVMVSTRGVMEKLIPPLAYLPYYATRENALHSTITPYLPSWALPFAKGSIPGQVPPEIRQYYEGGSTIPWHVWISPLLAWFTLISCVVLVFTCLATLLRRQWMDNEQLRFPLTILPMAMTQDDVEGQPFWSNKVMWLGFAFAAVIHSVNGLSVNYPDWPSFVLDLSLNPLFSERPWNQMDGIVVYISLAALGFAFFLPVDLLFSLWFFYLLTRVQDLAAVSLGGTPTSIVTHNTRVWTGYQAAGAYLILVLAQLRIGWPYFKQVWRTAFGKQKPLDDSDELMSYRNAILGLLFGFGGIVTWLSIAGMHPLLAAAQMGIYLFFVAVICSRGVCEAGMLMADTSFLPSHLIRLVYPLAPMGPANLSMIAMTNTIFTRDPRGLLLSSLLDSQKMAGNLRLRQRSLLVPLIVAFVLAFAASAYFFLHLHYSLGGLTLMSYPNNNAGNMYRQAAAAINGDAPPADSTCYGGFAVGVVVTTLLVWLRTTFTWFPLHPLAYAITPTFAMNIMWFPIFISWMIKSIVMRFGGIDLFRKIAPFMLGMVLGEFMMAAFWTLLASKTFGWSAPHFAWN